ncbi:hypothetical protein ElyMa_004308900 [Elysia marginata]|uniref:C2H2-type domain-containing protein n=1 Tax=Elysia marginata TaxID=1093978 RepID=A0AAV4GYK6_9GAST|nr:hypothetical protein ElyMa_004308900 [Elysia marginata]
MKENKLAKHMLKRHPAVKDGGVSKKKSPKVKESPLSSFEVISDTKTVEIDIPEPQMQLDNTYEGLNDDDARTALFICPFCKTEQRFSSLKALSAHIKSEHKEITLNCCFCEFSTSVLRKWHKHLRTAHAQSIDPLLNFLKINIQQNRPGNTTNGFDHMDES